MNILVINGPNINMLGIREINLYGKTSYKALIELIEMYAKHKEVVVKTYQSNHEGAIVDEIQAAYQKYDGIIINPGAYTHTSIAILDALKSVSIPCVEVHISNVNEREAFRKQSFVSLVAEKRIIGKGIEGYLEAMEYLIEKYNRR